MTPTPASDRPSTARTRFTATALISAPVLTAGYGIIRLNDGQRGPGPGWTSGHLLFDIGVLGYALILVELRRSSRRRIAASLFTAVGLLGALCVLAQITIDLWVGAVSADRAAMDLHYGSIQSSALVNAAVYGTGPLLFYVGLLALSLLAAAQARPRLSWRVPVAVLAGTVLAAASLNLLPVAALCYGLAFVPEGVRLLRTGRPQGATLPDPAPRPTVAVQG